MKLSVGIIPWTQKFNTDSDNGFNNRFKEERLLNVGLFTPNSPWAPDLFLNGPHLCGKPDRVLVGSTQKGAIIYLSMSIFTHCRSLPAYFRPWSPTCLSRVTDLTLLWWGMALPLSNVGVFVFLVGFCNIRPKGLLYYLQGQLEGSDPEWAYTIPI